MMEIRRLTELSSEAVEQLSEVLVEVVAAGASVGFLPPLAAAEARAFWSRVLQPGVLLWIAEEGGQMLGTVQLHLCQKPSGRHRAEVAKLLVHPRAQRRGIGRRLMAALEEGARQAGLTLLVLDTREGDPSNLLYRSLGFQEAGRIPYFAQSGTGELDTTVIYYKRLAP